MKTVVNFLLIFCLVYSFTSCENDIDTLCEAPDKVLDEGPGVPGSPSGWSGTIKSDQVNVSINYQEARFNVVYDVSKYGKDPLIKNINLNRDYRLKSSKVSKSNTLIHGEIKYNLLNPIAPNMGKDNPTYAPSDIVIAFTINMALGKVTLSYY